MAALPTPDSSCLENCDRLCYTRAIWRRWKQSCRRGLPVFRLRIHGEHGRDALDPDGARRRYQWVRRAYSPFVSRYVTVSKDLELYLRDRVGIASDRIAQLYNGSMPTIPSRRGYRTGIDGCPFRVPSTGWSAPWVA